MAKAVARPNLDFHAVFEIDEAEARFLDALLGYGGEHLISAVKQHLGKAYIEGHEKAGIRFCKEMRLEIAAVLARFADARRVFDGSHDATRRDRPATAPPQENAGT